MGDVMRCTRCHQTRTDLPVIGICPCGGHRFDRDPKPPEPLQRLADQQAEIMRRILGDKG